MSSSYFDSAKSEEEANRLPYNDDLGLTGEMDPVELEMTEMPRSSRVRVPYHGELANLCTERYSPDSQPLFM